MKSDEYMTGNLAMRNHVRELKQRIADLEIEKGRLLEENKRLIEQLNYYAPPMPTNKADTK